MEQIPKEVMEKIEAEGMKWFNVPNPIFKELFRQGGEYGYRLASPCALCEGKEKEIAELKKQLEDSFLLYHNMTTTIATRDRQLSELEAEKERRGILIEKYFISTTMTDMVINGWSAEKASNETQKEWNKFKTENGL